MRSVAWWHFQWPWRTSYPVFKVTAFWSRISQKWCILGTKLLKNSNRKPYEIYWMVPLSMRLSDLWPGFQGHDIFEVECQKNKVTIAHEEIIPNIWNGTMFGDLDWPLNASSGFVSISWASCYLCKGRYQYVIAAVCLCERWSIPAKIFENWKSCGRILMKFFGEVGCMKWF